MAWQLDPQEHVSFREMLLTEVITSEAILNLLDRKGIIGKRELMEEMKRVQAFMVKAENEIPDEHSSYVNIF